MSVAHTHHAYSTVFQNEPDIPPFGRGWTKIFRYVNTYSGVTRQAVSWVGSELNYDDSFWMTSFPTASPRRLILEALERL